MRGRTAFPGAHYALGIGVPPFFGDRRIKCGPDTAELFFQEAQAGIRKAKRLCKACPLREKCLRWAVDGKIKDGLWGGKAAEERAAATKPPATDVRKPPTLFGDCGERKAYQRHLRRGEEPCDPCAEANRRWDRERSVRRREQQEMSQKRCLAQMGDAAERAGWVEKVRSMAVEGICDSEIGAELGLTKRQVRMVRMANGIPSGWLIVAEGAA